MTFIYILLGIIILILWATMDHVFKMLKKLDERVEDIEDVLVDVKANTEPLQTEFDSQDELA